MAARSDGLSLRRRRHALPLGDRLDAQPRPPRRRVVPRQGPAAPLAGGRRVVLGHAGGRRPREQHAGLAVGRGLRRRRGAVLPHLQPGDAGSALRPGRRLRAPLGPRAGGAAARRGSTSRGRLRTTSLPKPESASARPTRRRSSTTARPAPARSPPTRSSSSRVDASSLRRPSDGAAVSPAARSPARASRRAPSRAPRCAAARSATCRHTRGSGTASDPATRPRRDGCGR